MKKQITDYIKRLTERDKKTLSQKGFKASEELGELAKVLLPFDNAHSTNHRFVDKQAILEECVDLFLVIKSISYDLGFDEDDWEMMALDKLKKWDKLQVREEGYYDKEIPYEIHVTVQTDDLDRFKVVCNDIGVKPIILELQNKEGYNVMMDVMTSSVYRGDNRGAFAKVKWIESQLEQRDFKVVRSKIETVPWHPSAPQTNLDIMPPNCYFESHFAVLCNDVIRGKLLELADKNECHLSQNIFKKVDDKNYKIMMTFRSYNCSYDFFKFRIHGIERDLHSAGFEVDKAISEFSIYDTKVSHDCKWLISE